MQLCVLLLVGAGKSISEIFATVGGAIRKNSSLPPLQELLGRKRAYLREATFARGRDLFLQWKQERMLGEREPGEMLTAVPSALSAAAEVGGDFGGEGEADDGGDGGDCGGAGGGEGGLVDGEGHGDIGSGPCDIGMTVVANDAQGNDGQGGRVLIHRGVYIEVEKGAIPQCAVRAC